MRADQGLTLIELLIVIVILGILSAIIVFSVEGITNRGEAASCEASAQTVRIAAQAFYAQGQGPDQAARYPNDLQELVDDDFVDSLPGTLSADGLTLTFATGTFFVYNPTTGSVDSTGCGTVGSGGGGPSASACVLVSATLGNVAIAGTSSTTVNAPQPTWTIETSGTCGTITAVVSGPGPSDSTTVTGFTGAGGTFTKTSGFSGPTWFDSDESFATNGGSSSVSIQNNGVQIGTDSVLVF